MTVEKARKEEEDKKKKKKKKKQTMTTTIRIGGAFTDNNLDSSSDVSLQQLQQLQQLGQPRLQMTVEKGDSMASPSLSSKKKNQENVVLFSQRTFEPERLVQDMQGIQSVPVQQQKQETNSCDGRQQQRGQPRLQMTPEQMSEWLPKTLTPLTKSAKGKGGSSMEDQNKGKGASSIKGKGKGKGKSSKGKGESISKCQDESTTKDEAKGSWGSLIEGQGKGKGAFSTEGQGKGKEAFSTEGRGDGNGKSSTVKGDFISKCQEESATEGENMEDIVDASTVQETSVDSSTIQEATIGEDERQLLRCWEAFGNREVQFCVVNQYICSSSYLLKMSMNNFVVERNNDQGFLLTVERYELTLEKWLMENPIRWCSKHESWNSAKPKPTKFVKGVSNWNSSRPTKECIAIIAGVVKAVFDYHASGNVHGYLNEPSSFLLTKMDKVVMDDPVISFHVTLTHSCAMNLDRKNVSKGTDIKMLDDLIFNTILVLGPKKSGRQLPVEWIDFRDELNKVNRHLFYLKTHPCLWHKGEKMNYYILFFRKFVQSRKLRGRNNTYGKFVQAIHSIKWDTTHWKDSIPIGSPLERFYCERERDNSEISCFGYVRDFCQHYLDKNYQNGKAVYKYIKDDEKDYLDPEYVEMCCTECFPSALLNTYKKACENKLYTEL